MTQAIKYYIEENKSKFENNDLHLVYVNCPLYMLKELVEVLSIAGIGYPPELDNYVTVCCYITDLFYEVHLEQINYNSDHDDYVFITTSLKHIDYDIVRVELFDLIPSCIDCTVNINWHGCTTINIKIRND